MNERQVHGRTDFLKEQRVISARKIAFMKKNIRNGLYPREFSFPITMQFELTSQCNLSCKHCYNSSSMDRIPEMQLRDWLALVDDIIAHGGIFQCILSGGEPLLLGDGIFRIMDPLQADGTGFVLITNGYLVTDQIVGKLKKYNFFWVQVSIDHLLPGGHDEFRGKKGSWQRAVNAALSFSSAGFPLRIAHSVVPASIDYLEDFLEFAYLLGASAVVCGEVMLSGRVNENRDLLFGDRDYEKFYATIGRCRKKYEGKMDVYVSADEASGATLLRHTPNCGIIIRPDGDARLDCTMPFTIGNVMEKKFSAIWDEKAGSCWKDEKIGDYIKSLQKDGYAISHVNHVDADIKL